MKFRVLEIQTVVNEYEVDAKNHDEAEDKVRYNRGCPMITRTKTVDYKYESENLTLATNNQEGD